MYDALSEAMAKILNCYRWGHNRFVNYSKPVRRSTIIGILILLISYFLIIRTKLISSSRSISNISEINNENHTTDQTHTLAVNTYLLKNRFTFNSSDKHICDQLYSTNEVPNLFSRLDDEFRPFQNSNISSIDMEYLSVTCPSCHHVQIIDNELYIVPRPKAMNYETRSRSIKMLINRVVDAFDDIPNVELFFNNDDIVHLPHQYHNFPFKVPVFAITQSRKINHGLSARNIILMPCFTFWSWPQPRIGRWSKKYESLLRVAQELTFEKRIPKLFWRGISSWKRKWILDIANKYPDKLDIDTIKWIGPKKFLTLTASSTYKTLEQNCNYKYLLHQEGVSYSSRLKYLLLCGSTVIYRVLEDWEEYWYHLLENGTNIIFFKGQNNEEELLKTVDNLIHDEENAKKIGQRGQQLVKHYLSEKGVLCYWWKLLQEYGKLFQYKPTVHPDAIHIEDFVLGGSP